MISKSLKNVGGNSAGMKGKLKSFEDILLALKYGCSGKRTKTNERLVSVIKDLESTLIREWDDQTEKMAVQVKMQ